MNKPAADWIVSGYDDKTWIPQLHCYLKPEVSDRPNVGKSRGMI